MLESSLVRTLAGFVGLEVSDIGADMSALDSREFGAWCEGLKRKEIIFKTFLSKFEPRRQRLGTLSSLM